MMAKLKLSALTWSKALPCVSLCQTTKSSPQKPNNKPSHCRRLTLFSKVLSLDESQMAVSTGCSPTMRADKPEPMPALTAAQTPPK